MGKAQYHQVATKVDAVYKRVQRPTKRYHTGLRAAFRGLGNAAIVDGAKAIFTELGKSLWDGSTSIYGVTFRQLDLATAGVAMATQGIGAIREGINRHYDQLSLASSRRATSYSAADGEDEHYDDVGHSDDDGFVHSGDEAADTSGMRAAAAAVVVGGEVASTEADRTTAAASDDGSGDFSTGDFGVSETEVSSAPVAHRVRHARRNAGDSEDMRGRVPAQPFFEGLHTATLAAVGEATATAAIAYGLGAAGGAWFGTPGETAGHALGSAIAPGVTRASFWFAKSLAIGAGFIPHPNNEVVPTLPASHS